MENEINNDNDLFHIPKAIYGSEPLWAEIILPLAIPRTYTYSVPQHLQSKLEKGCRAEVVFGKNKKYAGMIRSFSKQKPAYETKDILNIIDDEPIIYPQQLSLWKWISEYYMCSEGEVMAAALPTHFKLSSETILIFFGSDLILSTLLLSITKIFFSVNPFN